MADVHKPILGLIGGIGCGKSSLARWLADNLRARVIDADAGGHAALRREDVKSQLVQAFGEEILTDGNVDRAVLARRVFGDTPAHIAARKTLEGIVYPVMREDFEQEFAAARAADDVELIVFDAAVMLESGWNRPVDVVVYVDVPFDERLRRVTAGRGWSEDELRRREASQWPLDKKQAAAHVVVDNSGTVESAGRQLDAYLRQYEHLRPEPVRESSELGSASAAPSSRGA